MRAPWNRGRTRRWLGWPLLLCGCLCACLASTGAQAAPDTFGLGDGHSGALNVAAGKTVTVNAYAQVTAALNAGDTTISVDGAAGIKAQDLILLWQATGLGAPATQAATTTTDLTTSNVGRFELARVASVMGKTFTLTAPLTHAFDGAVTQVVQVPEYTTVTVAANGVLAANAWSGGKGGLLAFLATGAITNDGTITASAAGARGGAYVDNPGQSVGCGGLDEAAPKGAQKGEGVANLRYGAMHTGRGSVANGAGGGVCRNAGGGGGGNGGAGGKGGQSNDGDRDVGGLGGGGFTFSLLDHLSLGGGGGAGHGNDHHGTAGGAGGGAIFIRAASLAGGGAVTANGASAADASDDGAGGGGAGGTIVLRLGGAIACGAVQAIGGNGGNCDGDLVVGDRGPGGGGGFGKVLLQGTSIACNVILQSGAAGTVQGGWNGGSNRGATPPGNGKPSAMPEVIASAFCTADAQCPMAAPHCIVGLGVCAACGSNADCSAAKPICDGNLRQCRACAGDADCGGATPACQTGGPLAGACGTCSATNVTQCKDRTPVCDTMKAQCRACTTDSECGAMTPACQTGGALAGACTQCSAMNNKLCAAPTPACNADLGACVLCVVGGDARGCAGSSDGHACRGANAAVFCGCATDADCGAADSGRICDPVSQKCADGCSPAPGRNHCPMGKYCTSTDATGKTTGLCANPCASDADCKAPTPLCVMGAMPHCGECRGDADCAMNPKGQVCDLDQCVECTASRSEACSPAEKGAACLANRTCGCNGDGDCGGSDGGRICDGTTHLCGPGCRGRGGNGCAGDEKCSSTDEQPGQCAPIAAVPDGGFLAVTGGGYCTVARTPLPAGGRDARPPGVALLLLLACAAALARRRRA